MAISRYPGNQATWTQDISIAPPGSLAAPLFDFYPSLGDVTIGTATNIDTVQDGPMKVIRYGALTVNALLTTTQRCRGLMILCDSLVMGAAGVISMTGKGARGAAAWPRDDMTIPHSARLSAKYISRRAVIDYITQHGIWIGDPVFWAFPDAEVGDCRATLTPGSVVLLSAAGCGAATPPARGGFAGVDGGTGAGASGAGSTTTNYSICGGWGARGNPWGGGPAGGGVAGNGGSGQSGDAHGGEGGDAYQRNTGYYACGGTGNPGGAPTPSGSPGNEGTGGKLVILCRGDITRNATDSIQSNGVKGVDAPVANCVAGSGSGGGNVSIINGGAILGAGNTTANGGAPGVSAGGTYGSAGYSGGAGSVVTKTFAQMGWT